MSRQASDATKSETPDQDNKPQRGHGAPNEETTKGTHRSATSDDDDNRAGTPPAAPPGDDPSGLGGLVQPED